MNEGVHGDADERGVSLPSPPSHRISPTTPPFPQPRIRTQLRNLKEMLHFLGSLQSYASSPEAASLLFQAIMSCPEGTFPRTLGEHLAMDPELPLHACLVEDGARMPAPLVSFL